MSRWIETRLAMAVAAAVALCPLPSAADPIPDAWQRPHADAANTGYANVVTAPATKPLRILRDIGPFNPGAGPVIGPDGTVYVGNTTGLLMAFHRDGTKAWSRQLAAGQQILASPVVGGDGSIYVVSQSMFTDNRVNPPFTRPDLTLHKFLPGGGYAWQVPFPVYQPKLPVPNGSGGTNAAPNIWRSNGVEAVMVPVSYTSHVAPGREVRLLAFATDTGAVIGDAHVSTFTQTVTGSGPDLCGDRLWCIFPEMGFDVTINVDPATRLPQDVRAPMPPVAIYSFPGGGTPWIVVSDNLWDIVGFTFQPGSGFTEHMRAHNEQWNLVGGVMVMPDTETFVGERKGVIDFHGQGIQQRKVLNAFSTAVPSRTAEDSILFPVSSSMGVRQGGNMTPGASFAGQTMVSAAVSQRHIFVSTANAFVTIDASTLQQVASFPWQAGGTSQPAIGPYGDVYAIAGNAMNVFAAPRTVASLPTNAPVLLSDSQPGAPIPPVPPAPGQSGQTGQPGQAGGMPTQSHYEDPQGPHGMRLYACTDVGGDHCGKAVANAYCQAQGWHKADHFDTKGKKVQAETLNGQTCNKDKCKVFDYIDCEN